MSAGLMVLAGAGGGTGAAVAHRFAKAGYTVALLARNKDNLASLAKEIESTGGKAIAIQCDVSNEESVNKAIAGLPADAPLSVAVYNVATFVRKPFLETTLEDLKGVLDGNTIGAFLFSKAVLPKMLEKKSGTLIFSGATAGMRGGANFAAFAASKFGLRAISQSIAREHQKNGIHSIHVNLDGGIDGPRARSFGRNYNEGECLTPEGIADAYWYLHNQPRDVWTQEMDLRPYKESF